jgi:hypothetical protein
MARRSTVSAARILSEKAAGKTARSVGGDTHKINVRMYRQGLGDCFLITLFRAGSDEFRLMIDCGVILGTTDAQQKLAGVVRDIIKTTDEETGEGGFVDILAVTHEHYDHVAAFELASDLFTEGGKREAGKLAVGEVWFAWTEDPDDKLANRIRKSRADRLSSLAAMADKLAGLGMSFPVDLVDTLRFFGVAAQHGAAKGIGATARAMKKAASFGKAMRYLRPGETIVPNRAPEVKVYVLGPPRDEKMLHKTDGPSELYHLGRPDLDEAVKHAAGAPSDNLSRDPYQPFESVYTYSLSDVGPGGTGPVAEFLVTRYYGSENPTPEADLGWRRIDNDWLSTAAELALALDSATNNTSLVLAIELASSRKILLFPADAQVGNWLSWEDVQFDDDNGKVTALDLLARTIFYKVGHHGSHNATLKAKGLEKMESLTLAFIPVDHEMALKKHWGQMPLPALVDALKTKTGGQVVRIDEELSQQIADVQSGGDGLWHEWTMSL